MSLVITIAQQKGGSGKTSLAAHLSVAWATSSHPEERNSPRVVALDADPQKSLIRWFEQRRQSIGDCDSLEVRAGAGWRLSSELARARREADIVVLDLPPGREGSIPTAFRSSNLVLVPLQLSPMDLWATSPTIEFAGKFHTAVLLVLNRVPARTRLNDVVIMEAKDAQWPMARATLGNRVSFAESLISGLGVTESAPSSLAAAEMRLLAREVIATAEPEEALRAGRNHQSIETPRSVI